MGRHMRFLAAVTSAALLLAACGGGDTPEEPDTNADAGAAEEPSEGEATDDDAAAEEPAEAAEPAELTMVIASAVALPKEEVATWAVPQAMGYFEEENLTVDIQFADGATAAIQAIASGSGDITGAGLSDAFAAIESGVPVKAVGGLVVNWPWRIATTPDSDVTECGDLEDGAIGVISLSSGSYPYARAFVEECGLDPDSIEYVPTGVGAPAVAALEGGDVDALALYTAAYAAVENTGIEFSYLENPEFFDPLVSLSWIAPQEKIENEADVLERFLRAANKGLLFSHVNPERAVELGYEALPQLLGDDSAEDRIEADTNSLSTWLESTAQEGDVESWTSFGTLNEEQLSASMDLAVSAGNIEEPLPIDEAYTDALLEAANDFDFDAVREAAAE